jgi:muramoyltetrapeptide carboxypeptidase
MNRKHFLGTAAALAGGISFPFRHTHAASVKRNKEKIPFTIPPFLSEGDLIGITSPAGAITHKEIEPALAVLHDWGFRTRIGTSIGKKDFTRGGTDEERRSDLQNMLDDREVKAILCARGGYGSLRIVDSLKWEGFLEAPKWVIGFSDITVLHGHIHNNCKVASIHSKMINSFPDDWSKAEPIQVETILSIRDLLCGKKMSYRVAPHASNKTGSAEGILVGGNLKTIESLAGTASDINTDGKILFLEDTGEYLYSIDRMFWNLKRTGKLQNLKGLIIGGFKVRADDAGDEFGKTVQQIVLEKITDRKYPVCFAFPVGHQRANFALACGVNHKLNVQQHEVSLTQNI